jgi:hypothetical protein
VFDFSTSPFMKRFKSWGLDLNKKPRLWIVDLELVLGIFYGIGEFNKI